MKKLIERWKAPLNDFWKTVLNWSALMLIPATSALMAVNTYDIEVGNIKTILGVLVVVLTTIAGCAKMTKK